MKVVIASVVVVFVVYAFYGVASMIWDKVRKNRIENAEKDAHKINKNNKK